MTNNNIIQLTFDDLNPQSKTLPESFPFKILLDGKIITIHQQTPAGNYISIRGSFSPQDTLLGFNRWQNHQNHQNHQRNDPWTYHTFQGLYQPTAKNSSPISTTWPSRAAPMNTAPFNDAWSRLSRLTDCCQTNANFYIPSPILSNSSRSDR